MKLIEISRGEQVMTFIEYLDKGFTAKTHRAAFERLAVKLLSLGFTVYPTPNMRLNKDDGPAGSGWSIGFPYMKHKSGNLQSSGVNLLYTGVKDGTLVSAHGWVLVKDIDIEAQLEYIKQKVMAST